MIDYGKLEPNQLIKRYILALALLVAFVLGGHGLHVATSRQGVLDEEVLNISGRQRMLSQRIVHLAHRWAETEDQTYRDYLTSSVSLFGDSHQWLMENAVTPGSPVGNHYSGDMGAQLDARSLMFVELGSSVIATDLPKDDLVAMAERLEDIALEDLLGSLNTAVTLFENAANDRAHELEIIQWAVLAATLLVLLIEVLTIFYPAHQTLTEMIGKLRHQAWHDQMTGLVNRGRFMSQLAAMIDDSKRGGVDLIVLALDLDGFKQVNDRLGHPIGDQVLIHVARLLERQLATNSEIVSHAVGRLGGDEFVIALQIADADPAGFALRLGNTIIDKVEEPIPISLDNGREGSCLVGVSVGLIVADAEAHDVKTLLSNADIALYRSKQRGKGVTTVFEPNMRQQAEEKHTITTEVRNALKNLQFVAHFQPQVDLVSGEITGVEALARWDHPTRGLIGPAEFLSVIAENRLLDALDGQIILNALQAVSALKAEGLDPGILSLNVCSPLLQDPEFCDYLLNISDAHGLGPGDITVEILETSILEGSGDVAFHNVLRLRRAGFGVAIDDFGAGFSSLSRVSNLEITSIKIDRALTQQVGSPAIKNVLSATAAMALGLNVTLLAEGVETAEQAAALRMIGVDIGQGFHWARPMPVKDLRRYLQKPLHADTAVAAPLRR